MLLTVGIGVFLSTLNSSITNTILPLVEKDLGISLVQSEWISLIYFLVMVLFQMPFGQLSDQWGTRRIFLAGFVLFTIGSILCAIATTYAVLLWGRAILGLGGAMVLSIGPALLSLTFPEGQRGRVLGLQGLMSYMGLSLGPVVGGWTAHIWGWTSSFLVTVPFGIAGLALGLWAVPNITKSERTKVDWLGIQLFIAGMASVTLFFNAGVIEQYHLISQIVLSVVFVAAFWLLIRRESRHQAPFLDLKLYRIANFRYGVLSQALNYLCFFLTLFLLPFYMDRIFQFSNAQIGMYLAITPIVMTVCSPLAGALSDRTGPRILTVFGMFCSTASLLLFALMAYGQSVEGQSHGLLICGLLLAGMGIGVFSAPNNSAILGAVSRTQQGAASGSLATFRSIGLMAGLTVGGTLLTWLIELHRGRHVGEKLLFVQAFSEVMWVGVLFGVAGIACALAMTNTVAAGISEQNKRRRLSQKNTEKDID